MALDAGTAIADAFREEWGRIVAALIRRTGNWDVAEDSAQQAFTEAARRWPVAGVPREPGAWLMTVARNRAVDRLRHERMRDQRLRELAAGELAGIRAGREPAGEEVGDGGEEAADGGEDLMGDGESEQSGIEDDRLRLMFTCCHPALALEARVALTLRTLAGLTTAEIANAFLVPEATMAKRLVRAKHKIASARIPYRVPPAHLLPERTSGVLAVLYLLFNEGYAASTGTNVIRLELSGEAIRLARLLHGLMPDEPEVAGLLALLLLQDSRRAARVDPAGDIVTLEDQDRSRWDRGEIDEAGAVLAKAVRRDRVGPYQLQALIAACHAGAASAAETDWTRIAALYGRLLELTSNPHAELARAVAVGMCGSFEEALALVDELDAGGRLPGYHLLHATRGYLLRRLDRPGESAAAYRQALQLARTDAERRHLTRQLQELEAGPPGTGPSPP